jgi:transcription antitermination factor NusG
MTMGPDKATETIPTIPTIPKRSPAADAARVDLDRNWYVLEVAAGRELLAADLVHAVLAGRCWRRARLRPDERSREAASEPMLAWVPQEVRHVRASRHAKARRRAVRVRLLPGYCFAALGGARGDDGAGHQREDDVARALAVMREMMAGDGVPLVRGALAVASSAREPRPAVVPRADMAALVEATQRMAPFADHEQVRARLVVGQSVAVRLGPMAGVSVEVAEIGRASISAWLPMLGARRLVTVPMGAFVEREAA